MERLNSHLYNVHITLNSTHLTQVSGLAATGGVQPLHVQVHYTQMCVDEPNAKRL